MIYIINQIPPTHHTIIASSFLFLTVATPDSLYGWHLPLTRYVDARDSCTAKGGVLKPMHKRERLGNKHRKRGAWLGWEGRVGRACGEFIGDGLFDPLGLSPFLREGLAYGFTSCMSFQVYFSAAGSSAMDYSTFLAFFFLRRGRTSRHF